MPTTTSRWLNTSAAAAHTGHNADEMRRMAVAGTVPAHKHLGRWRFDAAELDAWIRSETPQPRRPLTTRPPRRK